MKYVGGLVDFLKKRLKVISQNAITRMIALANIVAMIVFISIIGNIDKVAYL
jgi:hypothetical protein